MIADQRPEKTGHRSTMKTVRNQTRGTDLAHAEWRGAIIGRARGLLGRASLATGEGIVISPCGSVHMMFMRLPLDVVYVDKSGAVVKAVSDLRPWRVSFGGKGAHVAIELPTGTVGRTGTAPGDTIVFED